MLDFTKLKAFADDKINVMQTLKFAFGRVENIVGKGENAGYQHYLLFAQCFFQKASFSGSLKVGIVWYRLNPFPNKPWFLRVCRKSFENTVGKGDVTSNFSYSQSVFYPFGKLAAIFIKVEIVVCKVFQFGRV